MRFTLGDRVIFLAEGLRGRIISCDCSDCASGRMVAIDQYPNRAFPAVFPNGRHLRPAHRVLSGIARDDAAQIERHATELAVGRET